MDFGARIQESVFIANLDQQLVLRMKERLSRLIDPDWDKLHTFELCEACAKRTLNGMSTLRVQRRGRKKFEISYAAFCRGSWVGAKWHSAIMAVVVLMTAHVLAAQCYQFSGAAASLTVDITNLPTPTITSDGFGDTYYVYNLVGLTGNSVVLSADGVTTSTSTFPTNSNSAEFGISITSGANTGTVLNFVIAGTDDVTGNGFGVIVTLADEATPSFPKGILPNGLPITLPPIGAWTFTEITGTVIVGSTLTPFAGGLSSISSACGCIPLFSGMVSRWVQDSQKDGNWCWAAVAEMLAVNASGGVLTDQLKQCRIVSKDIGNTNCCANPIPASCNVQGTPENGLELVGFQASSAGSANALSEQEIMEEISCKQQLVGFEIRYDKFGSFTAPLHSLIIYGYQKVGTELMLLVFDPQGKVGSPVSYTDLLNGKLPGIPPYYDFLNFIYDARPSAGH